MCGAMDDPTTFDPASVTAFRVTRSEFDERTSTARLRYALDDRYRFEETITFEPAAGGDPVDVGLLDRVLPHLHVAAGTSYYKLAAPAEVTVEAPLSPVAVEFHRRLYDDGLREFAVRNRLEVPRPVAITAPPARGALPAGGAGPAGAAVPTAGRAGSRHGLVVPIGGGKDSMVLIEAVRGLDPRPRLFAVNPHPLVVELADLAGLELLVVRRRLDPELARLTAAGGMNGHVPITAIVSLLAVAGGAVYGYDTVAMAIERTASEATTVVDGVDVNHQFSKSLELERELRRLLADAVDPSFTYGSALRPYSELAIARSFAAMDRYHGTFCSCNAAFRSDARPGQRWCGHCPKCRFVALMLAPWMTPAALAGIIGRDLFADPGQIDGFAELMGASKPFECVGERRESTAAHPSARRQPFVGRRPGRRRPRGRGRGHGRRGRRRGAPRPGPGIEFPDPASPGRSTSASHPTWIRRRDPRRAGRAAAWPSGGWGPRGRRSPGCWPSGGRRRCWSTTTRRRWRRWRQGRPGQGRGRPGRGRRTVGPRWCAPTAGRSTGSTWWCGLRGSAATGRSWPRSRPGAGR